MAVSANQSSDRILKANRNASWKQHIVMEKRSLTTMAIIYVKLDFRNDFCLGPRLLGQNKSPVSVFVIRYYRQFSVWWIFPVQQTSDGQVKAYTLTWVP